MFQCRLFFHVQDDLLFHLGTEKRDKMCTIVMAIQYEYVFLVMILQELDYVDVDSMVSVGMCIVRRPGCCWWWCCYHYSRFGCQGYFIYCLLFLCYQMSFSYRIITMTSSLDIPSNSISNLDRSQAGCNFPLRKVLVKSAFLRKFEKEEWNFLDSKPLGLVSRRGEWWTWDPTKKEGLP